jgi:hypothetical protein
MTRPILSYTAAPQFQKNFSISNPLRITCFGYGIMNSWNYLCGLIWIYGNSQITIDGTHEFIGTIKLETSGRMGHTVSVLHKHQDI